MTEQFWQQWWKEDFIPFHRLAVNDKLVEHYPRLALSENDKILVPLCGKSLDILWLYRQGLSVLGIELVEKAVSAFFTENSLRFSKQALPNSIHYAHKEKLQIYCQDIFSLSASEVQTVNAVYDRGALIALPPKLQQRYAEHLCAILPKYCKILQYIITGEQAVTEGPPYSVDEQHLQDLYGQQFDIQHLSSLRKDAPPLSWQQRGYNAPVIGSWYLLQR